MTHNRMLDRVPSVAITRNRNELKIYQGNIVYLNDGDNFELRFFNPMSYKIGVEILFNGIKKGDSLLVMNPGQDIILERFLDEQRKMIFETYTVDGNNDAAVKAIQNNGVITFNFYEEGYKHYNSAINVEYDFPTKPIQFTHKTTGPLSHYGNSGSNGIPGEDGTRSFYFQQSNDTTTTFKSYNSSDSVFFSPDLSQPVSSKIDYSSFYEIPSSLDIDYSKYIDNKAKLETGRIESGEKSEQKLKHVNSIFRKESFYSVSYKLMPMSHMNKEISEIRQYCPNCSYRIRNQKWSFCPKCGYDIK